MVRVSLPFRGVAVVLVFASAAAGQTPLSTTDFSDTFVSPLTPVLFWQSPSAMPSFHAPEMPSFYETEMPPLLDMGGEASLASFDALAPKDSPPRLTPTPEAKPKEKPKEQAAECCPEVVEEEAFPCVPTCLPFACPPPSKHTCHRCARKQRRGHHNREGCGDGYEQGYGNPYLGWPCGAECYPGFCAPPPPPAHTCRRCQRKHGHQNCGGGYGGYGYGAFGGCMGCDGFMGQACPAFYCPPYPPQKSCRRCQRKHGHQNCGGNPGYGGYGYGGYDYDSDCGHRRGLFHRHSCKHTPPPYPPPCFAYPMQPYMDMGFCSDCDADMP